MASVDQPHTKDEWVAQAVIYLGQIVEISQQLNKSYNNMSIAQRNLLIEQRRGLVTAWKAIQLFIDGPTELPEDAVLHQRDSRRTFERDPRIRPPV